MGDANMKITLEIDDACVSHLNGADAGRFILDAIRQDPQWWHQAADMVVVTGRFGKVTDMRE